MNVVGAMWVFKHKKYQNVSIVRNQVRILAKSYSEVEAFNFEAIFAPVARLEAIRIMLA